MQRTVTVAADDFGLSRGITDTILEVVDEGPVRLVSVIPNGEAVEYALAEYRKRASFLALAVHINLTEGKALSAPQDVPYLTDVRGIFKYSVAKLWLVYLCGSRAKRAALRTNVHREIVAQCAVIRAALGTDALAVNGHQHVHLIPFIFDELINIPYIAAVRTVQEPFQWRWAPTAVLARIVVILLSIRASRIARVRNIATNDSFIGFMHSGRMTEEIFRTGLAHAKGLVEVLFHPGSALHGELQEWQGSRADIAWHYSPWRERERAMLLESKIKELIQAHEQA